MFRVPLIGSYDTETRQSLGPLYARSLQQMFPAGQYSVDFFLDLSNSFRRISCDGKEKSPNKENSTIKKRAARTSGATKPYTYRDLQWVIGRTHTHRYLSQRSLCVGVLPITLRRSLRVWDFPIAIKGSLMGYRKKPYTQGPLMGYRETYTRRDLDVRGNI